MFVDLGSGGPQIRGGKLRALAVGNRARLDQFPNVPTVAESGYPSFEAYAWTGFVVPAKTPREIVARLAAEYAKAVADPGIRQRLVDVGFEAIAGPFSSYTPKGTCRYCSRYQRKSSKSSELNGTSNATGPPAGDAANSPSSCTSTC